MRYFCPTCQQWHPAEDIAADLYQMCRKDVAEQLKAKASAWNAQDHYLSGKDMGDAFSNRLADVQKFLGDGDENAAIGVRRAFLFSSEEIVQKRMKNAQWQGSTVRGLFTLDFNWLLDAFYQKSNAGQNPTDRVEALLRAYGDELLFSQMAEVVFTALVGDDGKKRYMFDRIIAQGGVRSSFSRACPWCGRVVQPAQGRAPETVIGLVGGPRAGKTSSVVAVVSSLLSDEMRENGISLTKPNGYDPQRDWLMNEIRWYRQGYIVRKTEDKDFKEVPSYSLLVTIDNTVTRVLTFVDMPGEFWEKGSGITEEFFREYGRLYQSVHCIWYLFSKLGVLRTDLRGADDATHRLVEETADTADILEGCDAASVDANLSELKRYLENHEQRMPPVAVIMSKAEVLRGEDPDSQREEMELMEQYRLFPVRGGKPRCDATTNLNELKDVFEYDPFNKNYYLKEQAFYYRGADVRSFLRFFNKALLDAIEDNCERRFYFSTAAYGHAASADRPDLKQKEQKGAQEDKAKREEGKSIQAYGATPYRELYPVLWTFAITGGLPVRHEIRYLRQRLLTAIFNAGGGQLVDTIGTFYFRHRGQDNMVPGGQKPADRRQIWADIQENLLMPRQGETREYKATQFDHVWEDRA